MPDTVPITVAHGDGIGPEIMDVALRVLAGAGARIDSETIEIGEQVYLRGLTSGIDDAAWESIRRTRVFLKAPITTPAGRRIQEPQRHHARRARPIRERAARPRAASVRQGPSTPAWTW